MQPLLLADFGSTYTKVTAVDVRGGVILDTARAFTTVETDIVDGFNTARDILDYRLGKLTYEGVYACSSAAGGLRMVASGLVPDFTVEAAKLAALSAGAKVIKVYSYDLTEAEAGEICGLKPDIVLLTGGIDGGNSDTIMNNARMIATIPGDFPVVVSGNREAAIEIASIFMQSGKEASICKNVLPDFDHVDIFPTRDEIRNIFLKRIVRAKGLSRVQGMIRNILMPTPAAVMSALQCLSLGVDGETGVGNLMAVDVGGATTDVYSFSHGDPTRQDVVLKGLPEPFAKRTVEGDIGVRISARSLIEAVGLGAVAEASGLDKADILKAMQMIDEALDILPSDHELIRRLDRGLTKLAISTAVQRHSGSYELNYTQKNVTFLQTGKDLTQIEKVIGTGGPVIGADRPEEFMHSAIGGIRNDLLLLPKNPEYLIDRNYILSAMGLLAERHPGAAVRIMKRELGL